MTPNEILEIVRRWSDQVWFKIDDLNYRDKGSFDASSIVPRISNQVVKDLGKIKVILYGESDYECDTGEIVTVIYFEDHDIFIKKWGWYASYEGTNWDGSVEIVKPKQVIITYYSKN